MNISAAENCLPISLSDNETLALVEILKETHGKCVNTRPIRGFTECRGTCNSGTKYNRSTLKQDKKCECCSVGKFEEISVPIKCEDGIHLTVPISVPKSCTCQACNANEELQLTAYEFLRSTSRP